MKLLRFILVITLVQFTAFQAQAESLAAAMEQCRQVSNSLKRLVCYDQLAQRAGGLTDSDVAEYRQRPASSGTVNNNAGGNVAQNSQSTFGLEQQIQRQKNQELSEISLVVAKVKEAPYGHLIITLEDGQMWRQTQAETFNVKKGDRVTISRGMLNSFYMELGSRRTSVKRTK